MRDLIPWVGDRKARKAWDTVFSRDVLGSVIIGAATGKLVENIIALAVVVVIGPEAGVLWETVGYIIAWGVALPVGVFIFVYWHHISDTAQEAAEAAAETAVEKVDEKTDD